MSQTRQKTLLATPVRLMEHTFILFIQHNTRFTMLYCVSSTDEAWIKTTMENASSFCPEAHARKIPAFTETRIDDVDEDGNRQQTWICLCSCHQMTLITTSNGYYTAV